MRLLAAGSMAALLILSTAAGARADDQLGALPSLDAHVVARDHAAGCTIVERTTHPASRSQLEHVAVACSVARARFGNLLGGPVPAVRVVVWDREGYRTGLDGDEAVVFWPAGGVWFNGEEDLAVLPHEISHVLLAARYYGDRGQVRGGYGTPLPDWLEEGIAIWAEPWDTREARLARAKSLSSEWLDLEAIVTGEHPAAGDRSILGTRDGGRVSIDDALRAFYPQSIAVLSFLVDHGGPAAVRELADRLSADPEVLPAIHGLPGLPRDPAAVVRSWEDWLASPAEEPVVDERLSRRSR